MGSLALAEEPLPVCCMPMTLILLLKKSKNKRFYLKVSTRPDIQTCAEKIKLMTNKASGIQREIKVKGQKLGKVKGFKYLGSVVSDEDPKTEVFSRTVLRPITPTLRIPYGLYTISHNYVRE